MQEVETSKSKHKRAQRVIEYSRMTSVKSDGEHTGNSSEKSLNNVIELEDLKNQ